ncbi:MAG: hypothetical protein P8144_14430, partial [Gammaproteobacteria bacterium]
MTCPGVFQADEPVSRFRPVDFDIIWLQEILFFYIHFVRSGRDVENVLDFEIAQGSIVAVLVA